MKYKSVQMAEYLLPKNMKMTASQKQNMLSVKNRNIRNSRTFPWKTDNCCCGQLENILHIFNCEIVNENKTNVKYEEFSN